MTNFKMYEIREEATCEKNQKFSGSFESVSSKRIGTSPSEIVKKAIKFALENDIKGKTEVKGDTFASEKAYSREVMKYMKNRYKECGFINYQQKQEALRWDHRRVMRYLTSEKRVPTFVEKGIVQLSPNNTVEVEPDVLFEAGGKVEMVRFMNQKPTYTRTGKNLAFDRDMQLYEMVLYARKLGYKNITASLYFLKKASDTSKWAACEQEFFEGTNIIRMNDIYDGNKNDLDNNMAEDIIKLCSGQNSEQISKLACEQCKFHEICKYEYPSVPAKEETTVVASAKTVKYTVAQKAVIDTVNGVSRIIAAAGSGKTQTVAGRVANLIKNGTAPSKILCVTFSNAGAEEMRRKISRQLINDGNTDENLDEMKIMTFHSFEYEIAKENWKELGYARSLTVLNDVQRYSIIAKILREHPIFEWNGASFLNFTVGKSNFGTKGALSIVSDIFSQIKALGGDWKNIKADDIEFEDYVDYVVVIEIIKRYQYYEAACKEQGLIDFDDMELLSFAVIDNNDNYLEEKYGFNHIIIDEFQDSSKWQMELIKRFIKMPSLESLMIIGDDAQAIYGFRNTTPDYILNFQSYLNDDFKYKGDHSVNYAKNDVVVKDIMLTDNWRSKQEILDRASDLLDKNNDQIDKHIRAGRGNGGKVVIQGYKTDKEEYEAIAKAIKDKIDSGKSCENIAVLAYTKSELQKIASALTKKGIPSMFGAPEPLMENSRVRAILAFAHVINDKNDTKDAAIVANAIFRAEDVAKQIGLMDLKADEIQQRVDDVISKAREIDRCPNPADQKKLFLEVIATFSLDDEAVAHFTDQFEFMVFEEVLKYCKDFEMFGRDEEFRRIGNYSGVKLITAHSSKGLEWDTVFFTVNGVDKCIAGINRSRDREEIRRLEFVAMTRARDELYVTGTYLKKTKMLEYTTNIAMYEMYMVSGKEDDWKMADKFPNTKKK